NIGVRAFHPPGEVGAYEQVEDPVNAVRSDTAALAVRDRFSDVVSARRTIEACEGFEHGSAHVGPLLAPTGQPLSGRFLERLTFVKMMLVRTHEHGDRPRSGGPQ